jgi:hypothetical protein
MSLKDFAKAGNFQAQNLKAELWLLEEVLRLRMPTGKQPDRETS